MQPNRLDTSPSPIPTLRMRLLRVTNNFVRNEGGNALIELAVTLSLIGVPLLLGTVYTSILLQQSNEITNAAHVGAVYGMRSSSFASDFTGIIAAAKLEAPDLSRTIRVNASTYYACSSALDGTQYIDQPSADAACNGGSSHTLQFVKVTTSAAITPLGRVPGLPASITLTGLSVMEVQE